MKQILSMIFGTALLLSFSLSLHAKVSKSEADKLGVQLTPFGSIREGNEDKTIPEWNEGIKEIPQLYQGPGTHHADPYADDNARVINMITVTLCGA